MRAINFHAAACSSCWKKKSVNDLPFSSFPISSSFILPPLLVYGRGEIVANCLPRDIQSMGKSILRQRPALFHSEVDDSHFAFCQSESVSAFEDMVTDGSMTVIALESLTG